MKYTVYWLPDVEQELADLWLSAPGRGAVTRAAHAIDRFLQSDPQNAGESRPNGRRILFAPPLGVLIRVIPDDLRVEIVHLWRFD